MFYKNRYPKILKNFFYQTEKRKHLKNLQITHVQSQKLVKVKEQGNCRPLRKEIIKIEAITTILQN